MAKDFPFVRLCYGKNGMKKVVLRERKGSSAEVYLYGAHVTSWKTNSGKELLYLSKSATFKKGKCIRGGITICFPQLEKPGLVEEHGFAQTSLWSIEKDPPSLPSKSSNRAFVDLILDKSVSWNISHEFRLRLTLGVNGDLMLTSRVRNTKTKNDEGIRRSFKFGCVYQNHIAVTDIRDVRVEGLETLHYFDNLKDREPATEQFDSVTFEDETDNTYLRTPDKLAILDHRKRRTIVLRKDAGLPDAVVWNPWEEAAKALRDFGKKDYNQMVLVGSAALEKPIKLKPGEEWTGKQILSYSRSCYNDDRERKPLI